MTARRLSTALLVIIAALSLAVSPSLRHWTQVVKAESMSGETEGDIQRRNQGAFARALGELRATASDIMFVKMNVYLHAGVAYDTSVQVSAMEVDTNLNDAGAATVIRSAGDDFRGFLGNLEREVKPYRDQQLAHIHTTAGELTPWFRVMTLANPQFIRGYRVGGLTIADEGKWYEALDFMNEGLEKNPDNPQRFLLHLTLASFHRRGMRDETYPWGDAWLEKTLHHAKEGLRIGREYRPPNWKEPEGTETPEPYKGMVWTTNVEEDFQLGVHLIPLMLRERYYLKGDIADLKEALNYATDIATLLPDYSPMQHLKEIIADELRHAQANGVPKTEAERRHKDEQ